MNTRACEIAGLHIDARHLPPTDRGIENARVIKLVLEILGTMVDGIGDSNMTVVCQDGMLSVTTAEYDDQAERESRLRELIDNPPLK